MSRRTIDRVSGVVTTTDGTQTTLVSFTVPSGAAVQAQANVVGRDTTTSDAVVARQLAAVKRGAGAASLSGAVIPLVTTIVDTALVGSSVTMDVSGNDVRVRVTGAALKTIEWFADLTVWVN